MLVFCDGGGVPCATGGTPAPHYQRSYAALPDMSDAAQTQGRSERALRELFASGHPLLYLMSADEERVAALLRRVAQPPVGKPVPSWSWSVTEGLRAGDGEPDGTTDPRAALDFIAEHVTPGIFHLKDFHEAMRASADVRRRLRDLFVLCKDRGQFVVISAPVREIPEDLAASILYLELSVPDFAEMRAFLLQQVAAFGAAGLWVDTRDATLDLIARALLGLTLAEAGFALRRAA